MQQAPLQSRRGEFETSVLLAHLIWAGAGASLMSGAVITAPTANINRLVQLPHAGRHDP